MPDSTSGVGGSSTANNVWNAIFTDKKDNSTMTQSDFLKLMVAQLQNQDFTNPTDNSDMINQMTAFANMQQMQDMAYYSRSSYAMSLVGKTVTASRFTVNGDLDTTTGPVQKVSFVDDEYVLYVGGKKYSLEQIMGVGAEGSEDSCAVDPSTFEITAESTAFDSITLHWPVPTEDEITAKDLKYTVYYSKEGPFETLEEVEAGTKFGSTGGADYTKETITGLEPDTSYYINIVVEDANGNKAVYKTGGARTKEA